MIKKYMSCGNSEHGLIGPFTGEVSSGAGGDCTILDMEKGRIGRPELMW